MEVFDSNRKLVPTNLGKTLYKCYNSVDPELVAPELRGNMERLIARIEKGEKSYDEVLAEMIETFRQKFIHFRKNIELLDKELGKQFKVGVGTDGLTGRPSRTRSTPRARSWGSAASARSTCASTPKPT